MFFKDSAAYGPDKAGRKRHKVRPYRPRGRRVKPPDPVRFLEQRGLCPGHRARVSSLTGGVSSDVVLVRCGHEAIVVKHALRRFRVRRDWRVDPGRLAVEFAFAHLIRDRIGPGVVAEPLAYDPAEALLAICYVSPPFGSWKHRLLAGRLEPKIAQEAAGLLARIHRLGLEEPALRRAFHQPRLFKQQRIDPYLVAASRRHPSLAKILQALARHLSKDSTTLIHGDFSPKNILTDGRRIVLIDHEVATFGDPRFDVAFLVNHLLLKAVRRPTRRIELIGLGRVFLDAYRRAQGPAMLDGLTARLVGGLLLARVDGKSPVEYLSERQRERTRRCANTLLLYPPEDLNALLAAWPPSS